MLDAIGKHSYCIFHSFISAQFSLQHADYTVLKMARIATYVFLDLETSGIPSQDLNKTKITEFSMVVVKRRHILETQAGALPRVQHKLTMCVNPGRMVEPGATAASGLDNDLLEHESMFTLEVFNTINSFLTCLEKPICLIAENGHTFDFPILKNHFVKLNVSLDADMMCADSLHAFYDILNMPYTSPSVAELSIDQEKNNGNVASGTSQELNRTQSNGTVNSKDEVDLSVAASEGDISVVTTTGQTMIEEDKSPLSFQAKNELTPQSKKLKITPAKRITQARRRLFYDGNPKPKESFKLKDIYERVLNRPGIEAHRAENDCVMTAEISTAKAKEFVEWIDNNHCAFSEVKAMRLGVKCGY